MEELTPTVADEILPELAQPEAQTYLLKVLLPQIRDHMAEGLVGDIRSARVDRSGVIVRNLDTNTEILRPDVVNLPDVQSYLAEISAQIPAGFHPEPAVAARHQHSAFRNHAFLADAEPGIYPKAQLCRHVHG